MLFENNWDEITPSFDEMNLNTDLERGIYAFGFERPSRLHQVHYFSKISLTILSPLENCKPSYDSS
jgi:hypothetical protein